MPSPNRRLVIRESENVDSAETRATLGHQYWLVDGNWHTWQVESLSFVGSTPTLATKLKVYHEQI